MMDILCFMRFCLFDLETQKLTLTYNMKNPHLITALDPALSKKIRE